MSKKFFPIKTDPACRLKWSWSTLYLTSGRTGSCHRASIENLTTENFFNFHNLPGKVNDREVMLSGQWPGNGCEYCRDIEHAGGFSDRQFQATVPNVYPPELDIDPTLTTVDPVVLEIFFKNTCNLSCIYCDETFSSSIEKENKKFGKIDIVSLSPGQLFIDKKNEYDKLEPLVWKWLENNIQKLKRLHILGGEPLLQDQFEKLLDFLHDHPNRDLELVVVTNLIIKEKHFNNCINKLENLCQQRKIKRLDLTCSVDSWGPAQEYVRYGFQRDIFEKNFKYAASKPWIYLTLLSTVNSLSIHEFPELFIKVQEWSNIGRFRWFLHNVLPVKKHVLSPCIFDYSIWNEKLDNVYSLMEDSTYDQATTKKLLKGIIDELRSNSVHNPVEQRNLTKYLDEIDRRRGLDWRSIFPIIEGECCVVQKSNN